VQPGLKPRIHTGTYTWLEDTQIWPDPVDIVTVEAGVQDISFVSADVAEKCN
jgi:hypothetical protein